MVSLGFHNTVLGGCCMVNLVVGRIIAVILLCGLFILWIKELEFDIRLLVIWF